LIKLLDSILDRSGVGVDVHDQAGSGTDFRTLLLNFVGISLPDILPPAPPACREGDCLNRACVEEFPRDVPQQSLACAVLCQNPALHPAHQVRLPSATYSAGVSMQSSGAAKGRALMAPFSSRAITMPCSTASGLK